MDWIGKMKCAMDYIEGHILETLDSSLIAQQVGTTSFHFQRMFHIITGVTVSDYVRRRRLTLAAHEIALSNTTIIDIALKYGYESHAAFTKAFTKLHGFPPVCARQPGLTLTAYPPISFHLSIQGSTSMKYKIRKIERCCIVGYAIDVSTLDGVNLRLIPRFWDDLCADGRIDLIRKFADTRGNFGDALLGICMDFNESDESFRYMIGVDSNDGMFLEGMERIEIDHQTYAVFTASGTQPDTVQSVCKRIFSEWFPATQYVYANAPELEVYTPGLDAHAFGDRCEVWMPITPSV